MWITPLPPSLTALGEGSHGSILNGNYAPNRLSSAWKPTIDRFDAGRKVFLMEQAGDWSRIRDDLTQHEGWIATRFLSETETRTKVAPAKKEKSRRKSRLPFPSFRTQS